MALAFTQSIPYTYWKVIISCLCSITIIFMIFIHISGYCKHKRKRFTTTSFKKAYLNAYTIVNIVTIFTLGLYGINCLLIFLSKFNLIINIVSCKIYNDLCAANWQIANFAKLSIYILRIEMAFRDSKYAYNSIKLFIFGIVLFLQCITNVILHIIFQYGSKYSIHNLFHACQYEVPLYIVATANFTDLIASTMMLYLFIKPLHELYQQDKMLEMMNMPSSQSKIKSIESPQQSSAPPPSPPSPQPMQITQSTQSNGTIDINNINPEKKRKCRMKQLVYKYTVLTFTATFSTFLILSTMSVIGSGTIIVFDYMINSFCLILMSKWYDDGKWFDKLCCGAIRCVECSASCCNCKK
eukprot:499281_1